MKAIIMAGGEGTRLKPVSGDTPKPLVKLCGRPVMEHIVLLLKKYGIEDICCTLKYRADDIIDHFEDGERFGVHMQYRIEREALGTAGGVKNCGDFYGDEDFLVISGDAVCDFDLGELIRQHEARRPAVSVALYRHSEPLRYGLALCDGEGRVRSFIEKPEWRRVVTDLVNTGIYILTPGAMALVPENTPFDFGKDLFPLLLKQGKHIYGHAAEGYWCDIGTPRSFYLCCIDALDGRLRIDRCGGFETEERIAEAEAEPGGERVPCRDRARLMGRVSPVFMELGADFSDGIQLKGEDFELSVSPVSNAAAVSIRASSRDLELAKELSAAAAELVRTIEKRLDNQ